MKQKKNRNEKYCQYDWHLDIKYTLACWNIYIYYRYIYWILKFGTAGYLVVKFTFYNKDANGCVLPCESTESSESIEIEIEWMEG